MIVHVAKDSLSYFIVSSSDSAISPSYSSDEPNNYSDNLSYTVVSRSLYRERDSPCHQ